MIPVSKLMQKKTCVVILAALTIVTFHQLVFFNWTSDDAFISYRYIENLISGKGLVFNTGEKVEGYSNFLWITILFLLKFLGLSPLWASKIISYIASLLLVILAYRTALATGLDNFTSGLCSLTISFSTNIAYYSLSGLESVFYTFLLLTAVFLNRIYEDKPVPKILIALYGVLLAAAITRPEGILFLILSSIYHLLKKSIAKKGVALKIILKIQLLAFSVYCFFLIFRYLYYGKILPNTFYAKPIGTFVENGYNAFFSNFFNAFLSGSFLLVPLLLLLSRKKAMKKYAFPLLFCGGQIIFMTYAGDWMAFGRFFLPILPIVIILSASLNKEIFSRKKNIHYNRLAIFPSLIIFIFLIAGNTYQTYYALVHKNRYPYHIMNSRSLIDLGKKLKHDYTKEKKLAVRRIGAISYYSDLEIIDILGLTDNQIAHNIKTITTIEIANEKNSSVVLEKKPDIIILFASESIFGGYIYEKKQPRYRLYHIEYLILNKAMKKGYRIIQEKRFGSEEIMIILAKEVYRLNNKIKIN